jgi:hypothetical protein
MIHTLIKRIFLCRSIALSLFLRLFPRSSTPAMHINIPDAMTVSGVDSSSSSLRPILRSGLRKPSPTLSGTHIRFPSRASRRIDPRYPPRTRTFPESLSKPFCEGVSTGGGERECGGVANGGDWSSRKGSAPSGRSGNEGRVSRRACKPGIERMR